MTTFATNVADSAANVALSSYSLAGGASSVTERLACLRARLDELGYRQPLDVESFALVERLLADLVHTTDSLRRAKLELAKCVVSAFLQSLQHRFLHFVSLHLCINFDKCIIT
jgi:hypothetical protein